MSKIVEAILAKDYDAAKDMMAEQVRDKVFAAFVTEVDAQNVPGNKVTSVDLPGSPPETDGDAVGAGEGIPSDYEGKGTPETSGEGADGGSAPGRNDPGEPIGGEGGVGEEDADYGPAVVTEQDDDDEEKIKDDDGEVDDEKKDKKEDK